MRWRATIVIVLISSLVLILASGIFLTYEFITSRKSAVGYATSLAEIIARNASTFIEFDRPLEVRDDMLDALKKSPGIIAAVIYTADKKVFAKYVREDHKSDYVVPTPEADGTHFKPDRLVVVTEVVSKKKRLGTLLLEADFQAEAKRFRGYGWIVFFVHLAGIPAAILLANRLQRIVSNPVLALARTAQQVAAAKN